MGNKRSSQFTTWAPDTSDTSATECDTNDTSATQTTRVKNFNFDHDTSENTFLQPYNSYITNERLQGEEEQFHFKNYLLEISRSHAKMHLKIAPQKLDSYDKNSNKKLYSR